MKHVVTLYHFETPFCLDFDNDAFIVSCIRHEFTSQLLASIKTWHTNLKLPIQPHVRIDEKLPDEGYLIVRATLGLEFDRKDHAALFKLAFGGAA